MSMLKTFFLRSLLIISLAIPLLGHTLPSFAQATQPATTANHLIWQLPADESAYKATPFAPGEVLVGLHRDQVRAAALLTTMAVQVRETVDLRGLDGAEGDAGIDGQLLQVPEGREWEAIQQLQQNPAVAFAVPNWLVHAADTNATDKADVLPQIETPFAVNDPFYADRQWYLQRINASRAWSLAYGADGFSGQLTTIRVAIVDSGIDFNHAEFKGRLLDGYNYLTSGATKPIDDYGHGTHVAGLIGATLNNGIGIAGVATKLEFVPYKVLNQNGTGTIANVAAAIRAAADNRARIINMSLETSSANPVMGAAVQYAYSKGALLIAAVGNAGASSVAWPAAYDEVMGVAATNYTDEHASYSDTGDQVEIAAPGGDANQAMLSTWPSTVSCSDLKPVVGYCSSEGTSMAAAVVSGAAALVMSVRPDLSGDQVRQVLRDTATPTGDTPQRVGSGRLDVNAALRSLLTANLQLIFPDNLTRQVTQKTAPYTVTVRIENPSLAPMLWQAKLDNRYDWVQVQQASSGVVSGTVRYGEPAHISLTITPTQLLTQSYLANLQVIGTRADKSVVTQTAVVSVYVGITPNLYYFPLILQKSAFVNDGSAVAYNWETPAKANDRTTYALLDDNDVEVSLPVTLTLHGQAYTSLRLFSDGYLVFPGSGDGPSGFNVCLPQVNQTQQAVYGWWADLDPSAAGATVSTFRVGTDHFVVEFNNVPSANGVTPAYRVSFQIVLYTTGIVRLNYGQMPDWQTVPPRMTIGVEANDGRFHNQVACKDNTTELGIPPRTNQSVQLDTQRDLY